MGECGVRVRVAQKAAETNSRSCFESSVAHDIIHETVKIAGAAQRRSREGLLHQGSIQCAVLPDEFPDRLPFAFAARVTRRDLGATVTEAATELAIEKYQTQEWTRRF